MIELLVAVLIASGCARAFAFFLDLHQASKERRRIHMDRFYEIAERISGDVDLDAEALGRIEKMAKFIDEPNAFWILWRAVSELEGEIKSGSFRPPSSTPFATDALREGWLEMTFNYYLAITYYRELSGIPLRSKFARLLDPEFVESNTETLSRRFSRESATAGFAQAHA